MHLSMPGFHKGRGCPPLHLPELQELDSSEMEEVEDVEKTQDIVDSAVSSYIGLGTVYPDPTTGKMYVMTQVAEAPEGREDG